MRNFAKYFSIALAAQALFLAVTWNFGPTLFFAEMFVYVLYAGPLMIVNMVRGGGEWNVSFFELFVLPMIMWSAVTSTGICFFTGRVGRDSGKFE